MNSLLLNEKIKYIDRAVYKKMPGIVARVSVEEKPVLIDANDRYFDFFGYKREEYLNMEHDSDDNCTIENSLLSIIGSLRNKEYFSFDIKFKNGKSEDAWVRMEGSCIGTYNENPVYQIILTDITELKTLQAEAEQENERFRIIAQGEKDIIFEYDKINDILYTFGSLNEESLNSKSRMIYKNFTSYINNNFFCHEDIDKVYELLNSNESKTTDVRCLDVFGGSGNLSWIRIIASPVMTNGNVCRIVGRIANIDKEKKEEQKKFEDARKDKLTHLYSRSSGEELIKKYLINDNMQTASCMLMIDVDGFTKINEAYGYFFGDTVLSELGQIILNASGEKSICARYNTDVMIAFIQNCSINRAIGIAKYICEETGRIYSGENDSINISCSIGISSSATAHDYSRMYYNARNTLEYVKKYRKGFYAYYLDVSDEKDDKEREEESFPEIKNPHTCDIEGIDDIISYSFGLLERSKDAGSGIKLLLSRLSKMFNLSGIIIYEIDITYMNCSTKYFWSRNEANEFVKRSFYFTKTKKFEELLNHAIKYSCVVIDSKNESIISELIDMSQFHPEGGEYSMVMVPSFSEGVYKSLTVFGDLYNYRVWNDNEKKCFTEVSKIINSYIEKINSDSASKAKSQFLSRMSHEIRTPMNAIIGMTSLASGIVKPLCEQLLEERIKSNLNNKRNKDEIYEKINQTADYLNKIDVSTKYLLSLVNDILDMSKIEDGKMRITSECIDMKKILSEVETVIKPQADVKNIELIIEKEYFNRYFIGDELRLIQIFVNIAGNAVKFTPKNGRVIISVKEEKIDSEYSELLFSFVDNGIGIESESISKIFKPFEQANINTSRDFGGTGLGLAISSTLIKLMGGELNVKSIPGVETEFFFSLKIRIPEQYEIVESSEDTEMSEFDFSGKKLLLAEDNELNAEIAISFLQMKGCEVEKAEDGEKALKMYLNNDSGYYDAILMDIKMPIMDGLEATKQIRKALKEDAHKIPIIAMSANAFDDDIIMSKASGMNEHLSKPIDVSMLYKTLDYYLKYNK